MSSRRFVTINTLVLVLLVLWLGGLRVWAQQEPERHDKHKDDPRSYCMPGAPEKGNTHGFECHCQMMCGQDEAGAEYRIEDRTCEHSCSLSHCLCHTEEPCPLPEK